MRAPGPCGDRVQREPPDHLHWAIEEEGQVLLGEIEQALLGLGEVPNKAQVDCVQLVDLPRVLRMKVLGKRLTWLVVLGQPVARPRTRQGIG